MFVSSAKDQTEGFARIDERFSGMDARLDNEFVEVKDELAFVNSRLNDMQAMQQLIVKILTERP